MNITIDENAGFCFGVVKAIGTAEEELSRSGNLYCLGDIVHNNAEVHRLNQKGLQVIDHEQLASLQGEKVLIRAHGEPPSTYQQASKLGIELIDATCPIVLALQQKIRKGYEEMRKLSPAGQVVIFGKPGHAEVIGLCGQTDNTAIVVSHPDDLDGIDCSRPIRLYSQTTKSKEEYQLLIRNLGVCYANGRGVSQDYEQAAEWFRKAAEQGKASAQYNLGVCYANGRGVSQDYEQAVEWYTKAAEQGDADAQYNLGWCYENGRGVSQDYEQAVEWYTKAAEQGNADAQNNLGVCYETGRGVSQDYEQAAEWYTKAAEQGDATAQCNLGWCYENGRGVSQDYEQAVEWYKKAAEQGNDDAIRKVEELEHKITMRDKKTQPKKVSESSSEVKVGPRYLFFDTETTGTPKDYKAPSSDTDNWPRLVQLGWILTDEQGNVLSKGIHTIKPDGFVIPKDAERVHGISTKYAHEHGEPLEDVLDLFMADFSKAKYLVGHNISFDKKVVGAELIRMGESDFMSTKTSYCTMEAATDFCKIPGYYGYKWPKLQELHKKLFGCEFEDAHDAMADITATCKCFWEMRKRNLI